jgi:lycopene cyclase domain-containing protein
MGEYTAIAVLAVVAVVALELRGLHTGLLQTRAYWIALAICYGFMVAVNGWLTKLTAPIVVYDPDATTGWRLPWDIPVEDYLFGYALLTLTMLLWDAAGRLRVERRAPEVAVPSEAGAATRATRKGA